MPHKSPSGRRRSTNLVEPPTMPYWPSSRVGAVPQQSPSTSKSKRKNEKSGKKKGITMEDLKKQTAIRLAQEQHRQGHLKDAYTATSSEPVAYALREDFGTGQQLDRLSTQTSSASGIGTAAVYPHFSSDNVTSEFERDSGRHTPRPNRNMDGWCSPSIHEAAPHKARGKSPESLKKTKSKLPHGLTVQELKEMTKARLQAEAADNAEGSPTPTTEPLSKQPNVPESRVAPPSTRLFRGWNTREAGNYWDTMPAGVVPRPNFPHSDFHEDVNVKRVRSYTDSCGFVDPRIVHLGPVASSHGESVYDRSVPFDQNRRRAATLSPRLGLSHVQGLSSNASCAAPSISTSPFCALRPKSFASYGSPSPVVFSPSISASTVNRPRTSSAASMPAMSQTADEFDLEPSRRSSPFSVVREESSTPGLSDAFRENTFGQSMMGDLGLYSDNRSRAATWSDGLMGSLGPGELSDDLASLLKLTGPDEE